MIIIRLILTLCLLFCQYSSTYAAIDNEIAESRKCTRVFPYFEKKFQIPFNTLHSIALKESGKKHKSHKIILVWPWTVNVEGQGYYFDTKKEAIVFVKKQIIKGKENIDVGCMQINLKHHLHAFDSLEQAFDPKKNIGYGAEFLKSKYDQLGSWHKAIAHYHSATHALGFKYKQDVVKIADSMHLYKNILNKYSDYNYFDNQEIQSAKIGKAERVKSKIMLSNEYNRKALKYRSNIMIPVPTANNR